MVGGGINPLSQPQDIPGQSFLQLFFAATGEHTRAADDLVSALRALQ